MRISADCKGTVPGVRAFTFRGAVYWPCRATQAAENRSKRKESIVPVKGNEITVDRDWKSNFHSGAGKIVFLIHRHRIREMRIPGD
jgi:hypothetical protein